MEDTVSTSYTLIVDDRRMLDDTDLVPIQKTFDFEAETLNQVLQGLAECLRAAGFTYVDELVAIKESGDETSSADRSGKILNVKAGSISDIEKEIDMIDEFLANMNVGVNDDSKYVKKTKKKDRSHLTVVNSEGEVDGEEEN